MKKFLNVLLIFMLIFSLSDINVFANEIKLGKPENLCIESKDDSYIISFKNSEEVKKLNDPNVKIAIDVSSDKNNWSSSNNNLLIKDFTISDEKSQIIINSSEIIETLGNESNSYSLKICYILNNQKGDFSNYLTLGSIGIYKNASSWAENDLISAQKIGLISQNMKVDMTKNITREEFAELLVRTADNANIASSHIESQVFTDSQNKYVTKVFTLGYMNGISKTHFMPCANITRQDAAVAINRMISDRGDYFSAQCTIQDSTKIAKYAEEAVKNMVSKNIFTVDKYGNFNPQKNITREQAVISVLRTLNN